MSLPVKTMHFYADEFESAPQAKFWVDHPVWSFDENSYGVMRSKITSLVYVLCGTEFEWRYTVFGSDKLFKESALFSLSEELIQFLRSAH